MPGEAVGSMSGSDGVDAFVKSMPAGYGVAFPEDAADHAAIAARRGERSAHLELWRRNEDGTTVVCVVADDRAGLLSTICRVFVAHDLDVVSARIHCRKRADELPMEAFDLFWLRPRRSAAEREIKDGLIVTLASEIEAAVTNGQHDTLRPGQASPETEFVPIPVPRVYFNTNSLRRGQYVLIVEAPDCPGLLLAISLALHLEGIEIASSEVRTENGMACDSFILEPPRSKPFSSERLAALRLAVVQAVQKRLVEARATG